MAHLLREVGFQGAIERLHDHGRNEMSENKPNVKLLMDTLTKVATSPEEWEQESWRCGTAMCFAGHAALLAGYKLVTNDANSEGWNYVADKEGKSLYDEESGSIISGVTSKERLKDFMASFQDDGEPDLYTLKWIKRMAEGAIAENEASTTKIRVSTIEDAARKALNIDGREADALFNGYNGLNDLFERVRKIISDNA